jgi:cephalosporin-C deacetylase-like acetyl esterase
MRFLTIAVVVLVTARASAQDLTILKKDKDFDPRKMLYNYLVGEAQKKFDERRKVVASLKTPEQIHKRQAELKAKFLEALGGFPEKTPLNAKVVGKLKGDGFTVERVIYESRPDHHVTANLYVPDGQGPFPGVLVPCGHSANGKAAEAYQRISILLAKNGMAALCYDPIGQGERSQLLDKNGKPAIAGSTSEHTMVGVGALLLGRNTATYRIWDGIRSLDYLESRPEVDPKRLGCTGNSGGGTLTAYLMALDERIACAAPSCYITSLERLFATIGPQDAEQNITGQVAFGMEHADYVTMRAPRPTLMLTASDDFFDIQGSWTTYREAKLLYGKLGYGERVSLFEHVAKHGYHKPQREAAVRWMRRWLLGKDDAIFEPAFPVFTDQELQCTRSGQVLEDFKGRSVFHMNADVARALAKERAELQRSWSKDRFLKQIEGVIDSGRAASPKLTAGNAKPRTIRGLDLDSSVIATEPGIRIPLVVGMKERKKDRLAIYLHEGGITEALAPKGPAEKLVDMGYGVICFDPRGIGETTPAAGKPKRPSAFGADFKETFLALHLRRPLLGQRVRDLHGVAGAFTQLLGEDVGFDVFAFGACGPIALHAAALDPRIKSVTLENALVSWTSVVENPISINQLTNVVPGALKVYDLPELAATIAPRKLTIRNPVDGMQRPVSQAELERIYQPCRTAYERAKAADKLILQAESKE